MSLRVLRLTSIWPMLAFMSEEIAHITTSAAAAYAHVKPSTVRRWVERGYLEPALITPGGHYRFTREAIERLLAVHGEAKAS